MKTLLITLLLSISIFGQSGKSVLTPAQIAKIDSMIGAGGGTDTPENYGADGTDDYDAFDSMFTSIPSGSVVKLKAGQTYGISGSSGLLIDSSIIIEGNGATLDFTNNTNNFPLQFLGSVNTAYSIPIYYTSGMYQIKVPDEIADSVVRGDIVLITSDASFGGIDVANSYDPDSHKGELVEVLSVSNDTLTLTRSLYNSYLASDTTKICRLTTSEVTIKNLNIKGTVGTNTVTDRMLGIVIGNCKDVNIDNVRVDGVEHSALYIYQSFNVNIDNFRATDFYNNIGNNYGIILGGVQNGSITNSKIYGGRHAIDISSYSDYMGSKGIIVSNNILSGDYTAASVTLSTHPNAEYLRFENNVIYGFAGIGVRSANIDINGNTIIEHFTNEQGYGIGVSLTAGDYGYVNISGNYIKGFYRGLAHTFAPEATIQIIKMENNAIIPNDGDYESYGLRVAKFTGDNTGYINKLIINDNQFIAKDNNWENVLDIGYTTTDTLYAKYVEIKNNTTEGEYVSFDFSRMKVDYLIVSGNLIKTDEAIRTDNSIISHIEFNNNLVERTDSTTKSVLDIDAVTNIVRNQNNTIKNFSSGTINDITADSVFYGGNIYINNLGTINLITADFILNYDEEIKNSPMLLSPYFWGVETYQDANNKITTLLDTTSYDNDFIQADTSKSPTLVNGVMSFDGVDDYLAMAGDDADFDFGIGDVSIECWVNTDTQSFQTILAKYGGINPRWEMDFVSGGVLRFIARDSSGVNHIISSPSGFQNEWHHIVAVWNRDVGAYLYIDASLVATETDEFLNMDVSFDNVSPVEIGSTTGGTANFFNGYLYGLRFYKQALTADEIKRLYKKDNLVIQ